MFEPPNISWGEGFQGCLSHRSSPGMTGGFGMSRVWSWPIIFSRFKGTKCTMIHHTEKLSILVSFSEKCMSFRKKTMVTPKTCLHIRTLWITFWRLGYFESGDLPQVFTTISFMPCQMKIRWLLVTVIIQQFSVFHNCILGLVQK